MEESWTTNQKITENTLEPKKVLGEEETYAYLAYKIIYFIKDQKTFTQDAVQHSVRQKIILFIDNHQPRLMNKIAKDKMRAFFDFKNNKQMKQSYNSQIFKQFRVLNASYNKHKIVFNPTKTTNQVFRKFLYPMTVNVLLYGNSGIGKTISICLMVNLFNIVTDYRITKKQGLKQFMLLGLIDEKQFNAIPKVIYMEMNESLDKQSCFKQISSQAHIQLPQKTYTLIKPLVILKDYYQKQQQMNLVFAIDQINVYYSLLRKILKSQEQKIQERSKIQMTNLLNILNDINNSSISIIYSSSPNFQFGLVSKLRRRYRQIDWKQYLKQTDKQRINYQKFRSQNYGYFEMIHTILFEYQNILRSLLLQQKQMQIYQKIVEDKISSLQQFLKQQILIKTVPNRRSLSGQLTHLRISQYLKSIKNQNSIQGLLKIFDKNNKDITQVFKHFLSEIEEYTKIQSILQYKSFLSKGSDNILSKKFQFLRHLKELTIQMIEKKEQMGQIGQIQTDSIANQCNFQLDIGQYIQPEIWCEFSEAINKENAIIKANQRKIIIFYSPYAFVDMVESIQQDFEFIAENLEQFFDRYAGQSPTLCGQILDRCCTTLLSHFQVQFNLCGKTHKIKNQKPLSFVQINEKQNIPNPKQIDPYQKFEDLINILKTQQLDQDQYFGAYPRLNQQLSDTYSRSSRCIDCLLIKKKQDKYFCKTIDFSVSQGYSTIKQKIKRADQFFTHLQDKMIGFDQFIFEHYFVLKKNMCEEFKKIKKDNIKTKVLFFASSIEQLNIENTTNYLKDKSKFEFIVYHGILPEVKKSGKGK